jgi:HK97 family phage prohead protease
LGDGYYERIAPTAFDGALGGDVAGLFNHDANMVLGRSVAGTLRLSVDEVGLRYEIDPPDTQTARDLLQSLKRGDISGSSFSFRDRDYPLHIASEDRDGRTVKVVTRKNLDLFDVGPVTFPAYSGSSAQLRTAREDIEAAERLAARDLDAVLLAIAEAEMVEAE